MKLTLHSLVGIGSLCCWRSLSRRNMLTKTSKCQYADVMSSKKRYLCLLIFVATVYIRTTFLAIDGAIGLVVLLPLSQQFLNSSREGSSRPNTAFWIEKNSGMSTTSSFNITEEVSLTESHHFERNKLHQPQTLHHHMNQGTHDLYEIGELRKVVTSLYSLIRTRSWVRIPVKANSSSEIDRFWLLLLLLGWWNIWTVIGLRQKKAS